MNKINISFGGGGFLLFIVFLILKLTAIIDWSWWIVTLPLWISLVCNLVIFILVLLIGGVLGAIALKSN